MGKSAIKSEFALLDILGKKRCSDLKKRLKREGPFEVVIRARVVGAWGDYDGMSQEFELEVTGVEAPPSPRGNETEGA